MVTIDGIIKKMQRTANRYKHMPADTGLWKGKAYGLEEAIKTLESHRPALEAGLRGTLRFRKSRLDRPGLYYCIQPDGRYCELLIKPWKTKDEVIECCKILGLTAVFEEEKP